MDAWERHQRLLKIPGVILPMYVIYKQPRDFPAHYVTRISLVNRDSVVMLARVACLYETLGEAVAECEALQLSYLPAFEQDDPTIVGTFL